MIEVTVSFPSNERAIAFAAGLEIAGIELRKKARSLKSDGLVSGAKVRLELALDNVNTARLIYQSLHYFGSVNSCNELTANISADLEKLLN